MAQTSAGSQSDAPRPIGLWTAMNVITVLLVLGTIAWAAALQRRNKDLERKVAALEKGAQARQSAKPAAPPRNAQAVAPATTATRTRKRRRAATAAPAPATQAAATRPAAIRPPPLITDAELARVEQLHTAAARRSEQGTATLLDVLRARRLLIRARFLHGDLTRQQYQQETDNLFAEISAKLTAMEQAGLADPDAVLEFYETMLSERR